MGNGEEDGEGAGQGECKRAVNGREEVKEILHLCVKRSRWEEEEDE